MERCDNNYISNPVGRWAPGPDQIRNSAYSEQCESRHAWDNYVQVAPRCKGLLVVAVGRKVGGRHATPFNVI
jgi:hypothetical protein